MFLATAAILSLIYIGEITAPYTVNGYRKEIIVSQPNPKKTRPGHYEFVSRDSWGARPPTEMTPLHNPVEFVVIHHSFIPPMCTTRDQCSYAMRTMQSMHVDQNQWADIGYNFAVGSDGAVYEGRGWELKGAHALRFNGVSLGICVIGNWNDTVPPDHQLQTTKDLINTGVILGHIKQDYKLVGHRQVRDTECPGEAFFDEIQTWPHFTPGNHTADVLDEYLVVNE